MEKVLLLAFVFVSAVCAVSLGKTCPGSNSGMSTSGSRNDHLEKLIKRYANCTKIEGNLEISYLENDLDLAFLHTIEEVTGYVIIYDINQKSIPLPNLRLIRGENLFKTLGNFSLFIVHNKGLSEFGLDSLIEISNGDVALMGNEDLLYSHNVFWNDTFAKEDSKVVLDEKSERGRGECHESCPQFDGQFYCWGPGEHQCQNFTKVVCKEECGGRCFGSDWNQCCAKSCAGGCTGRSERECFRCSYFDDDGACVDSCPPPTVYDHQTFKWTPNPKVRYAYGHECLAECPGHMYVDEGACVRRCSEGRTAVEGVCKPCDGPCPKGCDGTGKTFLSNLNIESFRECTVIQGNLYIAQTTFQTVYDYISLNFTDLSLLENVTLIEGSVLIEANSSQLQNLTFLRNVKTIQGKEPVAGKYGFLVYKTSLEYLGMESLQSVEHGRLLIAGNEDLCYVDKLQWSTIRKNASQIVVKGNRNVTECELENKVCHSECGESGCFGPLDTQCLECRSHKQGRRCLPSCGPGWFARNRTGDGPVGCSKCHEQCKGSCFGEEANQCHECLNDKDGPYCVGECPEGKYSDKLKSCRNCSSSCIGGCTGPENIEGPNGCNGCHLIVLDETGTNQVECLPAKSECPAGYYTHRSKQCLACHSECTKCYGKGPTNCDTDTCRNAVYDDKCVEKCPGDYFTDGSHSPPRCQECHRQCLTCHGWTSSDCHCCRVLKVYLNYDDREKDGRFNCTDACPSWAPFKTQEDVGGSFNTICVSSEHASEGMVSQKKSNAGLIVGLIVGALVLLALIAVLIFFLRRQRARWELEKTKMEAKIGGFDDETEPLALTGAAPDKAQLRIVRESEIRTEEVIGSGAFGTVHKGVWVPAGENVRIPVAIKVLNEGTSASQNKELLDEARIMASVDHPNCVRISAICMTSPIQLITPLMPFGSLLDYVRKNKNCIGSRSLLRWTTQIAKGMKYLEDRGIVHRDLAARNVLVRNANHVRITDFGLSKLLDVDQSQVKAKDEKLPIKWMAIESIRHRIFTHKSDVWSYGVTIWELFTYGQRPYEFLSAVDVLETLEKGERLSQPEMCTIDVYMIMIKCWMVDAASRPNFQELVEEFTKMSKDPGRYLVIQGDQFMKLPVQNIDTKDLVRDDGPEEIISAEDYYLQPVEPSSSDGKRVDGNNYVNTPKPKPSQGDASSCNLKKGKDGGSSSQLEGNRYTTDPTEKSAGGHQDYLGEGKELDVEIVPSSDHEPLAALVVEDKWKQQKGSASSLFALGREKLATDKKQRNELGSSEYLKMSRPHPEEDKRAMLAEFEDDTIDDDDYLTSIEPLDQAPQSYDYYNVESRIPGKPDYLNVDVKSKSNKNRGVSNV